MFRHSDVILMGIRSINTLVKFTQSYFTVFYTKLKILLKVNPKNEVTPYYNIN
jgi:hypothetical protein